VGAALGACDGRAVGRLLAVGFEGLLVGALVVGVVGAALGALVGAALGRWLAVGFEGLFVGALVVGLLVGAALGACDGRAVGREGFIVGALVVGVVGAALVGAALGRWLAVWREGLVVGALVVGVVGAALGRLLAVGRVGRCVLLGGPKRAIWPLFLIAVAPSARLIMPLMMVRLIGGSAMGLKMGPSTLLIRTTATAPRSCAWLTLRLKLHSPRVISRTLLV
jgi:hypothetical protein